MKMSDQMLASIMMALQKSLVEQSDIVPLLKGMELVQDGDEVLVKNPPEQMAFKFETE